MTPAPWFCRFAFAFGIAFAAFYVGAVKFDLALFTVYPSIRVVLLGTHHSRDSVGPSMGSFLPAMYWYGWIATMLIGSTLVGAVAARFPNFGERIPLFLVWLLPLLALPILAYVLMPFWTR